jgi:hypothetical protein
MELRMEEPDMQALAGIGSVFPADSRIGSSIKDGDEFSYAVISPDLGLQEPLSAGCLDCASRPLLLSRMERHLRTSEMLTNVEGDSVICVAPSQDPVNGRIEGLRAIHLRKGQSMLLETGSWHWIPFPLGPVPSRFLVVFRSGTGDDDLGFCDLAEVVGIVTQDFSEVSA